MLKRVWMYSPEANIKKRDGIIATLFWAVAILAVGFFLCRWGVNTGKISINFIPFIAIIAVVMPVQLVLSGISTIYKEKLKSLYVFALDGTGELYYFYLSSDAFLDTLKLRKYQIDRLRYRNFIYTIIRDVINEKNRKELLAIVRQEGYIEKIFSEQLQDKVGQKIHSVVSLGKKGKYATVKINLDTDVKQKVKTIIVYDVIDDFDKLLEAFYNKVL